MHLGKGGIDVLEILWDGWEIPSFLNIKKNLGLRDILQKSFQVTILEDSSHLKKLIVMIYSILRSLWPTIYFNP